MSNFSFPVGSPDEPPPPFCPDVVAAQACFDEGVRCHAQGCVADARACFERALQAWPDCAEAWANLGLMHDLLGDATQAEAAFHAALLRQPDEPVTWLNLGALLTRLQRFAEAEDAYRQALRLSPQQPEVWSNLGAMLACAGRDADAEACCRQALLCQPEHDAARINLSYLLLRQGRWEEGWLCYEARDSQVPVHRVMDVPRLGPGDAVRGLSLLLVSDAGLGDLLQMSRHVPWLVAQGAARITVYGQPALQRLLAHVPGIDRYIGYDEPLPTQGWDAWLPIMSLPYVCGTRVDQVPPPVCWPSLPASPMARVWPEEAAGTLRVGVVWRGNPRHENDACRSLRDLSVLAPLAAVPGITWVVLQHDATAQECAAAPWPVQRPPGPWQDLADTAEIVSTLDLVLSVDTSTVHLAGSLGMPTWVMLPAHKPDWRWLMARSDSPWYPGAVRLFRQRQSGDWAPVVDEVKAALSDWAASRRSQHTATDSAD